MAQLPVGWGDRTNTMSEKDRKLGGDAANRFISRPTVYDSSNNAGDGGNNNASGTGDYRTSEQVRAFYRQQIEQSEQQQQQEEGNVSSTTAASAAAASSLPVGWEDRQKHRQVEAKQYGVFGKNPEQPRPSHRTTSTTNTTPLVITDASSTKSSSTAEAALVHVTTTSLNAMAQCLEQNPVALTAEERAAFAAAMQRAMTAIAKCR